MSKINLISEKSNFKFSFKSIVIFIIFAIGIYFLIPKILDEKNVISLALKVKKPYLFFALVCEFASYLGSASLMGVILLRLGYAISFKDRFRLGSIAAFAIHFFPVSSLGESAIDFYFLRKRHVSAGSILLLFILRTLVTASAFLILFALSLLFVPSSPDLSFSPRIISLILFTLISSGIVYLVIAYKNQERFFRLVAKLSILINKILHLFKKKPISESKVKEIFDDLNQGIGLFSNRKRSTIEAIASGLLYWLGDIACLYFVFLSLGHHVNFGILILGYCVSTLLGQISLIPGGLGVTEGSMSLMYSALGVPLSLAIAGVLIFRFFSFWIWIPIGLISYATLKRDNRSYK